MKHNYYLEYSTRLQRFLALKRIRKEHPNVRILNKGCKPTNRKTYYWISVQW